MRKTTVVGLFAFAVSSLYAAENLAKFANIPIEDALICATLTPARAVGLESKVGKLAVGNRADFIIGSVSGKHIEIDQVFVGGEEVF